MLRKKKNGKKKKYLNIQQKDTLEAYCKRHVPKFDTFNISNST